MPAAAFVVRRVCVALCALPALGLFGCQQADYAADIVNRTPQPIYAQMFTRETSGAMRGVGKRLGPGDRAAVGPVRAYVNRGAYVVIDSMGNPSRPTEADLQPGTTFLEVIQEGPEMNSPLRVIPKR